MARRLAPAAIACVLAAAGAAHAQSPQVRVTLRPNVVKLGERATYRVEVIGGFWRSVEWLAPDSSSALTWGTPRSGFSKGRPPRRERFGAGARSPRIEPPTPDTAWLERPIQAFELGIVPVPGAAFRYWPPDNSSQAVQALARAPTTRLAVIPVLSAADSNATLHPVRGPLAAPWWERVPWLWVTAALAALALAVLLWRALRKRGPAPASVPAAPALSPAARALAALAELRAMGLPAEGRFAEHAFRLGQILRHYLEATWPVTRPGDTTPELVRHLADAGLTGEDVQRLAGLLRVWDRVKFAREPFTAEEASRAETAVEGFVHRAAGAPAREAA